MVVGLVVGVELFGLIELFVLVLFGGMMVFLIDLIEVMLLVVLVLGVGFE